jgi:hypothetical protein
LGANRGIKCVAGSDPLPFPGEETSFGTYATAVWTENSSTIKAALRLMMLDAATSIRILGRRNSPVTAAVRWYRNSRTRR